jgi:hypothetical protein
MAAAPKEAVVVDPRDNAARRHQPARQRALCAGALDFVCLRLQRRRSATTTAAGLRRRGAVAWQRREGREIGAVVAGVQAAVADAGADQRRGVRGRWRRRRLEARGGGAVADEVHHARVCDRASAYPGPDRRRQPGHVRRHLRLRQPDHLPRGRCRQPDRRDRQRDRVQHRSPAERGHAHADTDRTDLRSAASRRSATAT